MELIQSLLLGLLQGLTEFLPISSSGHLVLARNLLGYNLDRGVTFEIVVHFGTLCSIALYYREEIVNVVKSAIKLLIQPTRFSDNYTTDPNARMAVYIIVSMIPAMVVGFTLKDQIEEFLMNPVNVSIMLIVTGLILFLTRFAKGGEKELTLGRSLVIGMAQAFAIIPGVSRSGSTIATGLYMNMNKNEVANFSFLMVLPVIGGAMLLEVKDMIEAGSTNVGVAELVIGFIAAFVSGYFALKYLIAVLKKGGLHYFAFYCWIVGAAGLVWFAA